MLRDIILNDVRVGKPVIIVDDSNREDEGDLVLAAERVDRWNLSFCMLHARGLMCIPCTRERLERLQVPMMPSNNLDPLQTPFSVSVDAVEGTTTGMSVFDRLKTIAVMVDDHSIPNQLSYPGHMFPLRARDGLLKERQGHTESSVELVKLVGFKPVAVIIELMNSDGTMMRGSQLQDFASMYNINIVAIQEIHDAVYGV